MRIGLLPQLFWTARHDHRPARRYQHNSRQNTQYPLVLLTVTCNIYILYKALDHTCRGTTTNYYSRRGGGGAQGPPVGIEYTLQEPAQGRPLRPEVLTAPEPPPPSTSLPPRQSVPLMDAVPVLARVRLRVAGPGPLLPLVGVRVTGV